MTLSHFKDRVGGAASYKRPLMKIPHVKESSLNFGQLMKQSQCCNKCK